MNRFERLVFLCLFAFCGLPAVQGEALRDTSQGTAAQSHGSGGGNAVELGLKRLSLFSSGVGFFEHAGSVSGRAGAPAEISLRFNLNAVNDALKSLVVEDPLSTSPVVRYPSEETLRQTLRSLRIDLSGEPEIGEILNGLKGAELEVSAPMPVRGRIIGVEYRHVTAAAGRESLEPWLSLFTAQGIWVIALRDIGSFLFIDEKINADLNRALDLLMASRDGESRELLLSLPGEGSRNLRLSYVIPVPVWKVSYRLDLNRDAPFLQGWAIVDNDSDTDWKDVELSLVTGRPVSFIQNLYAPYRLGRPMLPLAIAGIADAVVNASGYGGGALNSAMKAAPGPTPAPQARYAQDMEMSAMAEYAEESRPRIPAPAPAAPLDTARGQAAGDQFEFTLKRPVTLERRQSAMLPLVEGTIKAEKTLVFAGDRIGVSRHPSICAELTNTSGMKLPAGPITVYDGGTYAGDALIEFFPENDKRLITFGDDLSVTGAVQSASSRYISAVIISRGVMTISRRLVYERNYALKNASAEAKRLIIEHPITGNTTLKEPEKFDERTVNRYRFSRSLPAGGEFTFTVKEEQPLSEQIALAPLRLANLLSYASNQEIPPPVRAALQKAVENQRRVDDATTALQDLENRKSRQSAEQERIRKNLEAAGNQTPQGQDYLKRLMALDGEIDALNTKIAQAESLLEAARKEYNDYLANLEL